MRHIPNVLTVVRILLSPFVYVFFIHNQIGLAFGLIVFLATTDLLDGYLARRFHAITFVGSILDPLADKLFSVVSFMSLHHYKITPLWFVKGLIITYSLQGICSIPLMIKRRKNSQNLSSHHISKWNTFLQFFVLIFFSAHIAFNELFGISISAEISEQLLKVHAMLLALQAYVLCRYGIDTWKELKFQNLITGYHHSVHQVR